MSFFKKVGATFDQVRDQAGATLEQGRATIQSALKPKEEEKHSHSHHGEACDHLHPEDHTNNRFHSFAPESSGNVKWYVDGASYFWAVSEAIERMCDITIQPVPPLHHSNTRS